MQNEMRDRLIELLRDAKKNTKGANCVLERELLLVDYLIENGVVVLPCKVGDKMYKLCIVNSRIKTGQMWDGRIVKRNCDRCGYRNCGCYDIGLRNHECETMIDVVEEITITSLDFLVKILPYVDKIWFKTKEEAEQKLKGGARE